MTPRIIAALAALATLPALPAVANALAIADAPRGAAVTVAGTVDALLSYDEFRLVDATGSIVVYVGPNPLPVEAGDRVTVSGVIDDDGDGIELYARQIVHADGSVVELLNVDE